MNYPTKDLYNLICQQLNPLYGNQEATTMAKILLQDLLDIPLQNLLLNKTIEVPSFQLSSLDSALQRLIQLEPIQHVVGFTHFFNAKFNVDQHTLIPRPETEELVANILTDHKGKGKVKILDIGTGSGCIPIALALNLIEAEVYACDISLKALAVAEKNAKQNNVLVSFFATDILHDPLEINELDIIVSNPPYIREQESAHMHPNVLEYEPKQALFVPNDNPLLFYKAISAKAYEALKTGGYLYFEINEYLGAETLSVVKDLAFASAEIKKDMQGKDRFIVAMK